MCKRDNSDFLRYVLTSLKLKACAAKIDFFLLFLKNLSFNIVMLGWASGIAFRFYILVNLFEKPFHNDVSRFCCHFLARLDKVQEELLHYPRCQSRHWRPHLR